MLALSTLAGVLATGLPAVQDPRHEFFEARVRPLLAERCHRCHGPDEQESGLRLDHGEHVLRGGERGPAVVPGDPEHSRLLRAVGYGDPDLQMPPKGRLSDREIDVLRRWIADGAFWPDEPLPAAAGPAVRAFDLPARRSAHWCWAPVEPQEPPEVDDPRFACEPIDRFVRARLAEAGLEPAPPADRRTWLRRVTFDLIGLPPTPEELDAFLADPSPDAVAKERVVDRLLASPHFGERQARHWMDLVRYAETLGHEYDFAIHGAWRYRDYLIRAFNQDVPYDRFLVEHVAGDLLDPPRRDPETGLDESRTATASWWFMDQTHSPVDTYQAQSDRIDNALDVLSKTFLGVTLACARCHDHKFDAISTADYYALYGVVKSSRHVYAVLDPPAPERVAAVEAESRELGAALAAAWRSESAEFGAYLQAASDVPAQPAPGADEAETAAREAAFDASLTALARAYGLDAERLARFATALADPALEQDPSHPLHPWVALRPAGERSDPAERWAELAHAASGAGETADVTWLADFRRHGYAGWYVDGPAFGAAPSPAHGGARPDGDGVELDLLSGGWAHSGRASRRLMGTLHSPDFRIDRRYLHVLVAGRGTRFNVVVDGFNLIRDPIYGTLKQDVDDARPRWRTVDLELWRGHLAYLQFVDVQAPDPAHPGGAQPPTDAWLAVQRVALSDAPTPPADAGEPLAGLLGDAAPRSLAELARRYMGALTHALEHWRAGTASAAEAELLRFVGARHLLPLDAPGLAEPLAAWRAAEAAIPEAALVTAMTDGPAQDEPIHIRGGHANLGDVVPRRFLQALGGQPFDAPGSGRLALARAMTHPDNPLTARVAVNRVWHHLFGRGLVATVDNFGVQGEPPTHPHLLDWLAARFVAEGWSIKQLVRRIVLSSTYGQSSRGSPEAAQRDPENLLLHRARVRRLEGEAIRDAILAVSGRLDPTLYGPSVPVHLTRFMDGRGRPSRSGPRDGDGRRSLYLEVRRNFLDPMFLAFDTPIPFSTVGRRSTSNVPAQALALMNDPFVHAEARRWAERVLTGCAAPAERIDAMYRAAFAREPSPEERCAALAFLDEQAAAYATEPDDPRCWTDLAHVLFNVKEFVFLD